jgi:hypothetical protein
MSEMFQNGAYFSGGSLRKMILKGDANIKDVFKDSDIDFFFESEKQAEVAATICDNKYKAYIEQVNKESVFGPYLFHGNGKNLEKTQSGFAYNSISTFENILSKNHHVKTQFIIKNCGTPEQFLSTFDIINCRVATNGKNVWVDEDFEKYEALKQIKIYDFNNKYLTYRLAKYLRNGYTLPVEDRKLAISKIIKKDDNNVYAMRFLASLDWLFENPLDIMLFYGKIGRWFGKADEDTYTNTGQIPDGGEDYASHLTKERLNNVRS